MLESARPEEGCIECLGSVGAPDDDEGRGRCPLLPRIGIGTARIASRALTTAPGLGSAVVGSAVGRGLEDALEEEGADGVTFGPKAAAALASACAVAVTSACAVAVTAACAVGVQFAT